MYQADTSLLYYMLYMIYLQPPLQFVLMALLPGSCPGGMRSLMMLSVTCEWIVHLLPSSHIHHLSIVNLLWLSSMNACRENCSWYSATTWRTRKKMSVTWHAKSTQPAESRTDIQKQWFYNPHICLCECTHNLCCLGGWQSSFFPLASIMDQACCQKACIAWGKFPFVGACGSEALNPL